MNTQQLRKLLAPISARLRGFESLNHAFEMWLDYNYRDAYMHLWIFQYRIRTGVFPDNYEIYEALLRRDKR